MGEEATLSGLDLAMEGLAASDLAEGEMALGHVGEKPVVVARAADGICAVGARCTHYGASLGAGLFDGDLVFCPLHHSAFDVRTGHPQRAPALNPVPRYAVEQRDGRIFVGDVVPDAEELSRSPLHRSRSWSSAQALPERLLSRRFGTKDIPGR